MVREPIEKAKIRQQLSDFMSNRGPFARTEAIEDRETMSALAWWDMYGVTYAELYQLAVKILSQSVNTSCAERAWSTYAYIHSAKRNNFNADRAESLVYVHYNQRLLSRYRADYEGAYKNWDVYANDDNLENDIEDIENREYNLLYDARASSSSFQTQGPPTSTGDPRIGDVSRGKMPRIE